MFSVRGELAALGLFRQIGDAHIDSVTILGANPSQIVGTHSELEQQHCVPLRIMQRDLIPPPPQMFWDLVETPS